METREEDRINLVIQTKELETDSKNFITSVVKTKNFEQKQIEKKINRQYKYSRSSFFNIDFMEFLQIIIVHCVIVNQKDPSGIDLPATNKSGFWRKVHETLAKETLFTKEIMVRIYDASDGGQYLWVPDRAPLLTEISEERSNQIKKYTKSGAFRFNLLSNEAQDNLRLPETYLPPSFSHLDLNSGVVKIERKTNLIKMHDQVEDQIIEEEDDFTSDFGGTDAASDSIKRMTENKANEIDDN